MVGSIIDGSFFSRPNSFDTEALAALFLFNCASAVPRRVDALHHANGDEVVEMPRARIGAETDHPVDRGAVGRRRCARAESRYFA